jgi:hypothetical protein
MTKKLPGVWSSTDLLDVDGQLLAELMVYADEEARVSNEEAARAKAEQRRAETRGPTTPRSGRRVAGRR